MGSWALCRPSSTERSLFIRCNTQRDLAQSAVRFLQTSVFAINQAMIPAQPVVCLSIKSILGNGINFVPIIHPLGIFML